MTATIYIIALVACLFLLWFSLVSFFEHEPRATKIGILLTLLIPSLLIGLSLLPTNVQQLIVFMLFTILILLALSFLFPGKHTTNQQASNYRIDERDTMFSRNEITHNKDKADEYYLAKPDKLELDKEWHKKPGLMNNRSSMYHALAFAAADASFFTIEQLRQSVKPQATENKSNINTKDLSTFIQQWAKKLGAIDVGICELKPYHFYSHRGRGKAYGVPVEITHKYAIALTVEMDKDFLATGPAAPTLMESAQQYLNSGAIAVQLAKFIANLGYAARAHIDGNYEVVCPLVARDAGMGDIGRMGLLMTPKLGPRVRIAVVTTEIPLEISCVNTDSSIQDFCSICKKCAKTCPSKAIPDTKQQLINDTMRWQINQEKCFSYWCASGTDCGRCMATCPYSHPNNLLHNAIRWGIKHSWLFRRLAVWLDDFIYGTKPKPATMPSWILTKE